MYDICIEMKTISLPTLTSMYSLESDLKTADTTYKPNKSCLRRTDVKCSFPNASLLLLLFPLIYLQGQGNRTYSSHAQVHIN